MQGTQLCSRSQAIVLGCEDRLAIISEPDTLLLCSSPEQINSTLKGMVYYVQLYSEVTLTVLNCQIFEILGPAYPFRILRIFICFFYLDKSRSELMGIGKSSSLVIILCFKGKK